MTEQTCAWCTKPTAGTTICPGCTKTLDIALANIRAYTTDLDTIRTRQTRYGDPAPVTRGGGPQPLPVDERFTDPYGQHRRDDGSIERWGTGTDLAWIARNTITGWTRTVLDDWPPLPDTPWHGPVCDDCLHRSCNRRRRYLVERHDRRPPRDNLASCCHYLQRLLPRIAAAEYAAEMLDESLDLERSLRRFVDRPPDRWYAGPCTAGLDSLEGAWFCGADLYVQVGKAEVTCRDCDATYDVADRRDWLMSAAEDRIETATTIARAVIVLGEVDAGETRLVKRISRWVEQGRLVVRGHADKQGRRRPMYRVGDVLDLATEDATRQNPGRGSRAS